MNPSAQPFRRNRECEASRKSKVETAKVAETLWHTMEGHSCQKPLMIHAIGVRVWTAQREATCESQMGLMRLGIKVDCVWGLVSYSGMNEMTRVHAKNGRSLPGSYFCLPRMSSTYRRFSCPVKMSRGRAKRCLSDSPLKLHHRTKHSCDKYLFIYFWARQVPSLFI